MARTPNNHELIPAEDGFSEARLEEAGRAAQELNLLNLQTDAHARAVAMQFGYEGALTVGAVEDEIRHYQRRTAEACFELGKRLVILRELTPHGEFQQRLEFLGFEYRTAARYMSIAKRFGKSDTVSLLKVVDSQKKLLELLVLDDEQLEELELTGSTGDLHLDKIATMSVKELRAALREANQNLTVKERQIADKNTKIDELDGKLQGRRINAQEEWSDAMRHLNANVAAHRNTFVESITALDVIREKVMEQQAEPGAEAALQVAREQIGRELLEALQRAEDIVAALRHKFDVTLGALIGE